MKIIALKSYKSGYAGIIEEPDKYVFFNYSKKGGMLKRLIEYSKTDYPERPHFLSFITKFTSFHFFLEQPITVKSFTAEAIEKECKATPPQAGRV
jgi:hypothetical protein